MTRQQESCLHNWKVWRESPGIKDVICTKCGVRTTQYCNHDYRKTFGEFWVDRQNDVTHKTIILRCGKCGSEITRDIADGDDGDEGQHTDGITHVMV